LKITDKIKKFGEGFVRIMAAFPLDDFIILCGFALLFHGLYKYSPSLSFSVCGVLLMAYGVISGGRK